MNVRRYVPNRVRRAVKSGYDGVRSRVDMIRLRRDLHRRYGADLIETVAPDDEMFVFIRDTWKWPFHVAKMRAPSDAMHTYLISGDVMMRDLDVALRDRGRELAQLDSFLEFACGHGRFTRFLVQRLDPARVTVADINPSAVDFERRTFHVSGFSSTESADDLRHDGQYEVVFVASLFSHLTIEHWGSWLRRLYELVAPGGLLVFSTHGPYARDVIYGKPQRDRFEEQTTGFWFFRSNETAGRLDAGYYGNAFVDEGYVRAQAEHLALGPIVQVYPATLWGSQDLYVMEKPAAVPA